MNKYIYKGVEIILVKGDITEIESDVIVNAANKFLKHGGGVAAAIVKKGGEEIQKESNQIVSKFGPLEVGDAVATTAGRLKARKIIHIVGPIYGEGREKEKLIRGVYNSLRLTDKLNLKTIAFPAISTGVFRVPPKLSAESMITGIIDYLNNEDTKIEKIYLVLYTSKIYKEFENTLKNIFKKLEDH